MAKALDLAKAGGAIDVAAIQAELAEMHRDDVRRAYWDMGKYPKRRAEVNHQGAVRALLYGELQRRQALAPFSPRPAPTKRWRR